MSKKSKKKNGLFSKINLIFRKPDENTTKREETHVVNQKTPFAIREAYKSLYTNVRYLNIEDKCKKIVVPVQFPARVRPNSR